MYTLLYLFVSRCAGSSLLQAGFLWFLRPGTTLCCSARLLLAAASLVLSMGSRHAGFSSCGAQVQLLLGIWNVLRPGTQPVSPAMVDSYLCHLGSQEADKCSFS